MAINLFFETVRSRELEAKVKGIDIVRLRCIVQLEKRNHEIAIHDSILDTGAFISLIPFSIWKDVGADRLADYHVKGIISKEECSIPVIIGRINLRLIDEKTRSREITAHSYLALTDDVPLIIGFKDLLERFTVHFDYQSKEAWLEEK